MKLSTILQLAARDAGVVVTAGDLDEFAQAVARRLLESGLTIHALDGRCVRVRPADAYGAPMTREQMEAVGLWDG